MNIETTNNRDCYHGMSTRAHQTLPIDPQRRERSAATAGCDYQSSTTAKIQGEIGMGNKPITNNNKQTRVATASGLSNGNGAELTRVHANITVIVGGKSQRPRDPEHRAKAEAFWSALAERRKQPGNCVRCGKPNAAETRQCPKCLAYQAKYRGRLQDKNEKLTAGMVVAIVKQCRREVTKLREIIKQMQRAHRAKNHRQWKQKRTIQKYADAYPEISKQELSQINHAYEAHED
jgi:hypothetical protein